MQPVGFIGLGALGMAMARRLLSQRIPVIAWNRSADKLEQLSQLGATKAGTPSEVMAAADLIGLCLTSHEAVRDVAWGPRGLFDQTVDAPKAVADFSTGAPAASVELAGRAAARNTLWLDVPVSGGPGAASAGTLIAFAGGTEAALKRLQPMLTALCRQVTHVGPSGSGQVVKLCNQMIVATNLVAIAEALSVAKRAGVEMESLPATLKGGFADSLPLQIFGPRMIHRSFTPPLGSVDVMLKDVRLALELARACQSSSRLLQTAEQLYANASMSPRVGGGADLAALIDLMPSAAVADRT